MCLVGTREVAGKTVPPQWDECGACLCVVCALSTKWTTLFDLWMLWLMWMRITSPTLCGPTNFECAEPCTESAKCLIELNGQHSEQCYLTPSSRKQKAVLTKCPLRDMTHFAKADFS